MNAALDQFQLQFNDRVSAVLNGQLQLVVDMQKKVDEAVDAGSEAEARLKACQAENDRLQQELLRLQSIIDGKNEIDNSSNIIFLNPLMKLNQTYLQNWCNRMTFEQNMHFFEELLDRLCDVGMAFLNLGTNEGKLDIADAAYRFKSVLYNWEEETQQHFAMWPGYLLFLYKVKVLVLPLLLGCDEEQWTRQKFPTTVNNFMNEMFRMVANSNGWISYRSGVEYFKGRGGRELSSFVPPSIPNRKKQLQHYKSIFWFAELLIIFMVNLALLAREHGELIEWRRRHKGWRLLECLYERAFPKYLQQQQQQQQQQHHSSNIMMIQQYIKLPMAHFDSRLNKLQTTEYRRLYTTQGNIYASGFGANANTREHEEFIQNLRDYTPRHGAGRRRYSHATRQTFETGAKTGVYIDQWCYHTQDGRLTKEELFEDYPDPWGSLQHPHPNHTYFVKCGRELGYTDETFKYCLPSLAYLSNEEIFQYGVRNQLPLSRTHWNAFPVDQDHIVDIDDLKIVDNEVQVDIHYGQQEMSYLRSNFASDMELKMADENERNSDDQVIHHNTPPIMNEIDDVANDDHNTDNENDDSDAKQEELAQLD